MFEHRAKTRSHTIRTMVLGVLVSSTVLATVTQARADGQELVTVPIEVRFDLINPCIENRLQDASMGMSADVFVDGDLDRSVTNHNGMGREQLELTVGSHDIEVTAFGYSGDKKTIVVRDNASQKFAFHVRSGSRIAVEVMRTHVPNKAHRWLDKLRRKGQPAIIRTISPPEGNEPEVLAVQLGPLPTCEAAEQRIDFVEEEFDRAAYIVPFR